MKIKAQTQIDGYSVEIFEDTEYCSVKLLPYKCLLFSASLDWLVYSGYLEDGDATHEVPKETIAKIKEWAEQHGYTGGYI